MPDLTMAAGSIAGGLAAQETEKLSGTSQTPAQSAAAAQAAGIQQGINAINTGATQSIGALDTGNTTAQSQLQNYLQAGNNALSPYAIGGETAANTYLQSLGVATPTIGLQNVTGTENANQQSQMANSSQYQSALNALQSAQTNFNSASPWMAYAPGNLPTDTSSLISQLQQAIGANGVGTNNSPTQGLSASTTQQVQQALQQLQTYQNTVQGDIGSWAGQTQKNAQTPYQAMNTALQGVNAANWGTGLTSGTGSTGGTNNSLTADQNAFLTAQNNGTLGTANGTMTTGGNSALQAFLSSTGAQLQLPGYDPNASGTQNFYNSPQAQALLGNGQSANNTATQNFMNSAQGQLLFNNGASPVQYNSAGVPEFQSSPGYQYALQQSNQGVQANAASKGLLNSGNFANALASNTSGMAAQQYQNYETNMGNALGQYDTNTTNALGQYNSLLSNTYNNWQTGLANAAATGASAASQQSAQTTNTGTQAANSSNALGQNQASVYTNQAQNLASGYSALGAANAAGIINGTNATQANSAAALGGLGGSSSMFAG